MQIQPDHSNEQPTYDEFDAAKRLARERLLQLPPEEAQARADSILFPHLWKVIDPRDLDWPGDLVNDDGDV